MQTSLIQARTITDLLPDDLAALQTVISPTVEATVHMCAVGDIMLSGRVGVTLSLPEISGEVFAEITPILRKADITFGNLETPLTGEISPDRLYSAPVIGANYLRQTGFNLINLANNLAAKPAGP